MKTLSVCYCITPAYPCKNKQKKPLDICGDALRSRIFTVVKQLLMLCLKSFFTGSGLCADILKKEKKPGSKMQSFFPLCKQRGSVCCKGRSLVDEQHGVSSTANSPTGLVFLLLQCRREWNSGLDIDWMGPECSLQPLICYLEALRRRERERKPLWDNIRKH